MIENTKLAVNEDAMDSNASAAEARASRWTPGEESRLIDLYMEVTGSRESIARNVYAHLCLVHSPDWH